MSSRKSRALRNRQDRMKMDKDIKDMAIEPKLDSVESLQTSSQEDRAEPQITIEEKKEETVKASDSVVDGLNASEDISSLESLKMPEDSTLEDIVSKDELNSEVMPQEVAGDENETLESSADESFSATEAARDALKANREPSADTLEQTPDMMAHSTEGVGTDDPDKVPVAPSLSDEEVPNKPGAILLHAREILGLSQREIAYKLNLRVNTVSDIEHDRLNQATAVPFASHHIANYARLVNIDPELLVALYKENVRKTISEQAYAGAGRSDGESSFSMKKLTLWACLVVLCIAGAGVAMTMFGDSEEKSSGTLVIEETIEATTDSDGTVSIDTENTVLKSNMVVEEEKVDANTLMARQQSKELDTAQIISEQNGARSSENNSKNSQIALEIKGDAAAKSLGDNNGAAVIEEEPLLENNSLKTVSLEDGHSNAVEQKVEEIKVQKQEEVKQTLSDSKKNEETLKSQKEAEAALAKAQQEKAEAEKAAALKAKEEQEKERAAQAKAQEKALSVALDSNLKNITSSVRLQGKRDPFAGTNSATITILGDVAMRVTGNGKAIASGCGNFKKGQTVKVMGIPPIVVSVSDSSKIRIQYAGGSVAVPAAKQVSFTLPQR